MKAVRPIAKVRRGIGWLPLDFSRKTPSPDAWRWMAALCLFVSVAPIAFALPLGWLFTLRVAAVCAFGAYRAHGLASRLILLAVDFTFLLWWMFGGYPQAPAELALAVFVLGVSFKAMELRTVGDGYMASAMCFLGPFLAVIQHLPAWITILSVSAIPLSLILRSGMSSIESGMAPEMPWKKKHWGPVIGMLSMALPVALALFWVLPRLPSPYFGLNAAGAGGVPETMEPGSMDRLMQDPSPALLVSFQGAAPDPSQMYWRAFVLSSFNGRTWFQVGMPPDTEARPIVPQGAPLYQYSMTMLPISGSYVPLMDRAISHEGARTIQTASLTYRSVDASSQIRQFTGTSAPNASLDVGVLSPVVRRANLSLPDGYNPRTRALMKKWKDQGFDGENLVKKTLGYFRDNMTYSYTPPLLGKDSVDELMFDTQEGFCEHFSSSFVFSMRAAGIPARVVSGYQGGRKSGENGWEVRQLDAHAWSEVWLENKGWVRVDPTFSVVKKRPAPPGDDASGFSLDAPWLSWVHANTSSWFGKFDQRRQQDMFSKWKMGDWSRWLVALGIGLVVMAWAFSAVILGWRSDRLPPQIIQWEKFQRESSYLTGLGKSATPRQIKAALLPHLQESVAPMVVNAIDRWELWRYAGVQDPHLGNDLAAARKRMASKKRRSIGGWWG